MAVTLVVFADGFNQIAIVELEWLAIAFVAIARGITKVVGTRRSLGRFDAQSLLDGAPEGPVVGFIVGR